MTTPAVTVIVPAYGDPDAVQACIDALAAQDDGAFEAVICDNGSQPPLRPSLPDDRFRIVIEPARGSYAARNRAVDDARGRWLAFTDADCVPSRDWISKGRAAMAATPDSVVAGRIRMFATHDPPTWVERYELQWGLRQDIAIEEAGYAMTANLWVARDVFTKVGPFDATLLSGGDRQWCGRATSAGHPLRFAPDVVVRHPARSTWKGYAKKIERVQAGAFELGDASSEHRRGLASILVRGTMPPIAHWRRLGRQAPMPSPADRARIALVHWRVKWTKMRVILRQRKAQR